MIHFRDIARLLPASASLATLAFAATAQAGDPIVIGTIAQSRAPSCGTITYSFAQGEYFSTVRSALESNSNFSPGGVVGRDIVFAPPMALVTSQALQGIDILFVSPMAPALSNCEVAAIGSFLSAGGGVFAFANDAADKLAGLAGASSGPVGTGVGSVARGTPMSAGPFGKVSGNLGWSFHRVFSSLGNSGQACISSSGVLAAAFTRGQGRIIIVNDEEWCGDQSVTGCAVSWMPSTPRLTLFLNAVAWVTPPIAFDYIEPAPSPDLDCDGDVDATDLSILIAAWGPCNGCRPDLNRDGQTNARDLGVLLSSWTG